MFCVKCGAKIEEGAAFCVQCGTPVQIQAQPAQGQPLQAQGQPVGQPAQGQSAALKVAIRILICLVAGIILSFLVSNCMVMVPTAMPSVVVVIILLLVLAAAYSALLFFLFYKPLEAKVGRTYALVGGIVLSVILAIALAAIVSKIVLSAAYTAIIYAYVCKFEKKKNRF
ncbi:MAG: zinc-ribbon domain-containing protein [Acutalibacteraceae bacterium]|jgi:FtsH-binding integral membrane protein